MHQKVRIAMTSQWQYQVRFDAIRMKASENPMDRAFGRAPVSLEIDSTSREMSLEKIVHLVRWLPPDPNDRSRECPLGCLLL